MLNKVMIIGRLGADPEMRYTANGSAVTTFNVATSRTFTRDGDRVEETEWFSIVTWNRLAETCAQYLLKGRQVYVKVVCKPVPGMLKMGKSDIGQNLLRMK